MCEHTWHICIKYTIKVLYINIFIMITGLRFSLPTLAVSQKNHLQTCVHKHTQSKHNYLFAFQIGSICRNSGCGFLITFVKSTADGWMSMMASCLPTSIRNISLICVCRNREHSSAAFTDSTSVISFDESKDSRHPIIVSVRTCFFDMMSDTEPYISGAVTALYHIHS